MFFEESLKIESAIHSGTFFDTKSIARLHIIVPVLLIYNSTWAQEAIAVKEYLEDRNLEFHMQHISKPELAVCTC